MSNFAPLPVRSVIETDILIIGAGPAGLFTAFQAGLLGLKSHFVDALPQPGGQLYELYPKKPIYDIPGIPYILASDLVKNLLEQVKPFQPGFTLGERADRLEQDPDGRWKLISSKDTVHLARAVVIAGGLGSFEPMKPAIADLEKYEGHGVDYLVLDPETYIGKRVVVAGGGDSALDWSILLSEKAASVTLVHRRKTFRGHPDSVQKVMDLAAAGKITLITDAEVTGIQGLERVETLVVRDLENDVDKDIPADHFLPMFGLSPKLGPMKDWNLTLNRESIEVNPETLNTGTPGIYAVGDICHYPGKIRLILSGFHEAAMAVHAAYKYLHPDRNLVMKYTTVTGIKGF